MTQTIDPVPSNSSGSILCCYVNRTSKIQVVRITNIPNWYFERVVFPGQRLLFESSPKGQLEIHSGSMASSILEDTIPCPRLELVQPESAELDAGVQASIGSIDMATEPSSPLSTMQPMNVSG